MPLIIDSTARVGSRSCNGSLTSTIIVSSTFQPARRNPTAAAAGSLIAGRWLRRPLCMFVGPAASGTASCA